MSQANAKAAAGNPTSSASGAERAASLNADGTQKWFIPPYIIPAVIVLLIAARAIYLS